MTLQERIDELQTRVQQMQANSADEVEALRIKYLSKKGEVNELFNEFRPLRKEQKQQMGQEKHALRPAPEDTIDP